MSYKTLFVMCLLVFYVIGCSTDNTDNESIFPVPPTIPEETEEATPPAIDNTVVDPLIPQPIVEEPVVEELELEVEKEEAIEEVDQEPAEEPEAPKDNVHPKLVDSTVRHGDVGIVLDTDRFIFTFDENIDSAIISLIDITQGKGTNMEWEHFIRGTQVVLLTVEDSLELRPGRAYTIKITVADEERNWHPDGIITFVTQMKE